MVMGVCRRVLGDHHEAEDAFQATFIVLVRRRRSLALKKSLGAWLHGVAFRTAVKAKTMSIERKAKAQLTSADVASRERDHTEIVAWSELAPILDSEIHRLPEKLRAAIVMCELAGYTHKDAAVELGLPLGTLSACLARAKEKLRRNLTRRGVVISSAGLSAVVNANATAASLSPLQINAALQTSTLV